MEENKEKSPKKKNPLQVNPLASKPGGDRPSYQVWIIVSLLTVVFGIMYFMIESSEAADRDAR